jgi:hypothetical protein
MDQAPPAVAQTVNRIIERTVERVVPAGQTAATVVTQEKTVIVKESQLISKAVELVDTSVVRLYSGSGESAAFLGLGIVVDSSGTIASDGGILGEGVVDAIAELQDKTQVRATVTPNDTVSGAGLVFFSTATTTTDGKPVAWTPVAIASGRSMLGETVVVLAGKTVARIAAGIITMINASTDTTPEIFETDIAADSILSGSPLINSDASLLGIRTGVSRAISPTGFVSGAVLIKPEPKPDEKEE